MDPTLLDIYKVIFQTWRWQVDSYWQRSSYFAAFETAAIAGCWHLVEQKRWQGLLVSVLAILLTVVWFLNNLKTHGYVDYWWRALTKIEAKLGTQNVSFVTNQGGSRYVQYHHLMQAVPVIFLSAWLVLVALATKACCSQPVIGGMWLHEGGGIMRNLISNGTFWNAVTAIFTGIASAGIFLAFRQLRFQAWLKAQEIWTKTEFTESRGRIFARLDKEDQGWSTDEKIEALQVCRKMDEFAGLIPSLRRRTALRVWGVPFAKAWFVLQPIVTEERVKCRWQDKWHAFEKLGASALRSHPEVRQERAPRDPV
jgi:hypothetical protein